MRPARWLLGRLLGRLSSGTTPPPAEETLGERLAAYRRPGPPRCSCGLPAAADEVDVCPACRTKRARAAAELEAYAEERRRRRRAARARREGLLEIARHRRSA